MNGAPGTVRSTLYSVGGCMLGKLDAVISQSPKKHETIRSKDLSSSVIQIAQL